MQTDHQLFGYTKRFFSSSVCLRFLWLTGTEKWVVQTDHKPKLREKIEKEIPKTVGAKK
jgi:hypothetical protein